MQSKDDKIKELSLEVLKWKAMCLLLNLALSGLISYVVVFLNEWV